MTKNWNAIFLHLTLYTAIVGCLSNCHLFLASLPLSKCFIYPKDRLYHWSCPQCLARDMLVELLTDACCFLKSVHSLCILCNVCVARQEQWYWQNEALEQGQLVNSLYLFNCLKVIGKACVFKTFQLTADKKTGRPTNQLISSYLQICVVNTRCWFVESTLKMQQ